jgi:hypothetical protein
MESLPMKIFNLILLFLGIVFLSACMASRNINNSAKVTPKGNFAFGINVTANLPTETIGAMKDIVKSNVTAIAQKDSIRLGDNLTMMNKAAIAYSIDPLSVSSNFFIRYGLFKHIDVGYKRVGTVNAFDLQYQFLGPTGNIDNPTDQRWYGSAGIQYSSQKQELPSILSKLQARLGFDFKRKDLLIPIILSYSFGNEEKYGGISFGMALDYSNINFVSNPFNIYTLENFKIAGIENDRSFLSLGSFVNLKLGYKYVYLVPSIAVYYQNYGNFELLGGNMYQIKSWTFIPSLGCRFRLGKNSIN